MLLAWTMKKQLNLNWLFTNNKNNMNMKKILMILFFVFVSIFSYSQTIHSDFSKTFEVTAWYEVETNDYHTIWEQSDNILNQNVKIKLSFNNTNEQTTITILI